MGSYGAQLLQVCPLRFFSYSAGTSSQVDSFFKQYVSRTGPTIALKRVVGPEGEELRVQQRIGLNYNLWEF